jgi:hypothetical protein
MKQTQDDKYRMDRLAPSILNRGQLAIMYIKQGGLREVVIGKYSVKVSNRPVLMGGCPPMGSQILSVSGLILVFFKTEPRHPPTQGGKRSISWSMRLLRRQYGMRLPW